MRQMLPHTISASQCWQGFRRSEPLFSAFSTNAESFIKPLPFPIALVLIKRQRKMTFSIPVQMIDYDGKKYIASMGPFEHSAEREFALTVNRRAIDDCRDIEQLRPVAKNLLEGWCSMNTAMQGLMLENIQLRQALGQRDSDLQAADLMMDEAAKTMEHLTKLVYERQSPRARWRLWPW